jgi:hypothetical protein
MPLDFDTLQPHGCFIGSAAVMVLGQHDRARDAALNVMRFFADESCGQCTPCRVGTAKAARLMEADAGTRHAARPRRGDGRRLDLRPGPGRAQPDPLGAEALCARSRRCVMNRPLSPEQLMPARVSFELDGQTVQALDGETILDAARRQGTEFPGLCHSDPLRPDGNCRACVVEVAGERVLAASCCRRVTPA